MKRLNDITSREDHDSCRHRDWSLTACLLASKERLNVVPSDGCNQHVWAVC